MLVLIDNYDSFVYNLVQMLGVFDADIRVVRNDVMRVEDIAQLNPQGIVLSPGPGRPKDAGICEDVVRRLSGHVPLLGVCLGHQAICEAYGARIVRAPEIMHGKSSLIELAQTPLKPAQKPLDLAQEPLELAQTPLFAGVANPMTVGRYHSLIAQRDTLPACLSVTAHTHTGEVMAVEHIHDPTYGVQFHPESILTREGTRILSNFVEICKVRSTR